MPGKKKTLYQPHSPAPSTKISIQAGMEVVLAAARPIYSEWKNLLVWNKANACQGSFYRSKHELIAEIGRAHV